MYTRSNYCEFWQKVLMWPEEYENMRTQEQLESPGMEDHEGANQGS